MSQKKGSVAYLFALLLLTTLILAGCQSLESFYRGYKSDNRNVISLSEAGPIKGQWKTFDLNIDYQYNYSGSALNISGVLTMGPYYEMNDSWVTRMDVYLFFLDNQSRVLETATLVDVFDSSPDMALSFNNELTTPPGTRSFAFGYNGESKAAGENGGRDLFYELPKRTK